MLRTEHPVVTNMVNGHAHFRNTTSIKPWTLVGITTIFVLVARTVVHTIAVDIHRQAVVLVWTPEVCLREALSLLPLSGGRGLRNKPSGLNSMILETSPWSLTSAQNAPLGSLNSSKHGKVYLHTWVKKHC